MTKITSVTKTYSQSSAGEMLHTGYFITSNNYRLKYAWRSTWDKIVDTSDYKVNLDKVLSRLQDAQ